MVESSIWSVTVQEVSWFAFLCLSCVCPFWKCSILLLKAEQHSPAAFCKQGYLGKEESLLLTAVTEQCRREGNRCHSQWIVSGAQREGRKLTVYTKDNQQVWQVGSCQVAKRCLWCEPCCKEPAPSVELSAVASGVWWSPVNISELYSWLLMKSCLLFMSLPWKVRLSLGLIRLRVSSWGRRLDLRGGAGKGKPSNHAYCPVWRRSRGGPVRDTSAAS